MPGVHLSKTPKKVNLIYCKSEQRRRLFLDALRTLLSALIANRQGLRGSAYYSLIMGQGLDSSVKPLRSRTRAH